MTREQYEAIDATNWSLLKHLGKSPAHYLHAKNDETEGNDTDAFQRGRVVHILTFEPHRAGEIVMFPDRRDGKKWDAFKALHADKEIVTSRMWETCLEIAKSLRASTQAAPYLSGGQMEMTAQWTYSPPPIAGFEQWERKCKGRIDFWKEPTRDLPNGALVDLKTTKDASPTGFPKEVLRYEAHVQLAFYADGLQRMLNLAEPPPVFIVAVEPFAPYVVQVYRVPEEILDLGRDTYEKLLAALRVHEADGVWPGYATAPMDLTLPAWARPSDDDDLDPDLVFKES